MPGRMITPLVVIRKKINTDIATAEKLLVTFYCRIGEECQTIARNGHTYKDQTGNLTSSIGYVVLKDGIIQKYGKPMESASGTDKKTGVSNGDAFLQEVCSRNNKGIVLIVTAGMNYALYVERRHYVVLSQAELHCEEEARKILAGLGFKVQ